MKVKFTRNGKLFIDGYEIDKKLFHGKDGYAVENQGFVLKMTYARVDFKEDSLMIFWSKKIPFLKGIFNKQAKWIWRNGVIGYESALYMTGHRTGEYVIEGTDIALKSKKNLQLV